MKRETVIIPFVMLFLTFSALGEERSGGENGEIWPYPDPALEAQLIALELSGQLRPPAELTEQIYNDLSLIRASYPEVAEIRYLPAADPYEIIVGLTTQAMEQFGNGEYHGLDELNETYGVVEIEASSSHLLLRFGEVYNTELLSDIYEEAQPEGLRYAEPNYRIGDGSTISAEPPVYTFIRAWGDCPSGCICHEDWRFLVENGQVTMLTTTYYVDALYGNDNNDGLSPESAFETIQAAIDGAFNGDEIIVAEGIYYERINFLGKGIVLRSTEPNEPNVVENTIINGEQNGSVVTFNSGEDTNCVLNGFTVTDGYASDGGGICCDETSPTINNCIITGNSATGNGGGIYNLDSNSIVTGCIFSNNEATSFGGGMYNKVGTMAVADCNFIANSGRSGGGIYNDMGGGEITDCTFSGNFGMSRSGGGGIYNNYSRLLTIANCSFISNEGIPFGWGMFNESSSVELLDCTFSRNQGGGMRNEYGEAVLTDCVFTGNFAGGGGGGMWNRWSEAVLTDCVFTGNFAEWDGGGGMYNWESEAVLTDCAFTDNFAKRGGGGMWNSWSEAAVVASTFSGNSTDCQGGGMLNGHSEAVVTNCTFSGNEAFGCGRIGRGLGGGMYNNYNELMQIANCVFINNRAMNDGYGGGIYEQEGNPTLINCILWGNEASNGPEIYLGYDSSVKVSYSDIKGGQDGVGINPVVAQIHWGPGNIAIDPCFVKPGYWDPNDTPADANDDFWVDGDYHLKSQAGRYNPNSQSWIQDDVRSALSRLKIWVQGLQFNPGFFNSELPIDASLFFVAGVGPRRRFGTEHFDVFYPTPRNGLPGH